MCCTIEPFGVVLCGPQGRHVPQTAVNNRVAAGEISHCSSVDFSTLSYHGCRVVSRVVGTAGHTADGLQDAGDVRDRASRTHGHESISAAGEQTTAVQQEDTDVVLTLILSEKTHLISHTLQFTSRTHRVHSVTSQCSSLTCVFPLLWQDLLVLSSTPHSVACN